MKVVNWDVAARKAAKLIAIALAVYAFTWFLDNHATHRIKAITWPVSTHLC